MERSERKILVVDDEPIICNLMRTAFSRAGYSIVAADSGAEALAAVNLSAFDLMFIDLNLRDMNGIDLFRAVRRLRPESVAYLMTGYASEADLIRCRRAEFADCLVKPVALSAWWDRAGSRDSGRRTPGVGYRRLRNSARRSSLFLKTVSSRTWPG